MCSTRGKGTEMAYRCNLCVSFIAFTLSLLLNHIGRCHSSDPDFHALCGINGCTRTYKKYVSFRNHVKIKHKDVLLAERDRVDTEQENGISSESEVEFDMNDSENLYDDANHLPQFDFLQASDEIRRTSALHLLKMKDRDRVSQTAIDSFVDNTTSIVRTSMDVLKRGLMNRLDTAGIDFNAVPGLPELFQEDSLAMNPFSGLREEAQQCQYYKDHFNLVEPRKILLGQYYKKVRRGNKLKDVRKTDDAYYIPLLENLQQLLNDDSVLEEVYHPHARNDGLLSDYCDGDAFRLHPLFSCDPYALQLILYFDEFEVCNPLGSRANKYKIGGFYYTLGNIRPENRSHKNAVQLLGLVTSKHLKKYGVDALLEAFMQDLAQLEQDAGYQFIINGEPRSFRGTVAFFCGDNLGSQFIGGFKEGSQSHRPCRECMGDQNQIKTFFHERNFVLRTCDGHNRQCDRLTGNPHYSKTYGIKGRSVLNNSQFYHVVGGMPPDAMHDILEGVLHYAVKEMLKEFIFVKKLITLEELNRRISTFDYGYHDDSNKPAVIQQTRLSSADHSIKQHANQMWCLARNLPLMIGGLIPDDDEHWSLFCDLLEIIRIVFAPTVSHNQVAYLQVLIQNHHEMFKELFPDCPIIPKMHYMIHMPRTMLRIGPLIRSWCMRFEAKHHEFKRLAAHLGNFTNLPYTLAKRHQEGLCYRLQTSEGSLSSFIAKGIETGPANGTYAGEVDYINILSEDNPEINNHTQISELKWVSILGTKYKVGCTLNIGCDEFDNPTFGKVIKICVVNKNIRDILFVVSKLNTIDFSTHYQSFEVGTRGRQLAIVHHKDLDSFLPLSLAKPYGVQTRNQYVVPRFDIGTNN